MIATVADAVDGLQTMHVRHLPVVDDRNVLVGIVGDRDLGSPMKTLIENADVDRSAARRSSRSTVGVVEHRVLRSWRDFRAANGGAENERRRNMNKAIVVAFGALSLVACFRGRQPAQTTGATAVTSANELPPSGSVEEVRAVLLEKAPQAADDIDG